MFDKRMAPKPDNFDAMSDAWDNPVAFAREVAVYNTQLVEAGHAPMYEVLGDYHEEMF
jgi:hypothetical protein